MDAALLRALQEHCRLRLNSVVVADIPEDAEPYVFSGDVAEIRDLEQICEQLAPLLLRAGEPLRGRNATNQVLAWLGTILTCQQEGNFRRIPGSPFGAVGLAIGILRGRMAPTPAGSDAPPPAPHTPEGAAPVPQVGLTPAPHTDEGGEPVPCGDRLKPLDQLLLQGYERAGATSARKAVAMGAAAKRADPSTRECSFKRANARLVRGGLLERLPRSEGRRMYLSALGLAELVRLRGSKAG